MIDCHISYSLDGTRGHVVIRECKSSCDGLLQWLDTVPPTAAVKAVVRALVIAANE